MVVARIIHSSLFTCGLVGVLMGIVAAHGLYEEPPDDQGTDRHCHYCDCLAAGAARSDSEYRVGSTGPLSRLPM